VSSAEEIISFDHHVHYYPQFSWQTLLDSSWQNLTDAAAGRFEAEMCHAAICLLETQDSNWFDSLPNSLSASSSWQVDSTHSKLAMRLHKSDGRTLTIIKGRQLVTRENLEVLVLGDNTPWRDVPSLEECLQRAPELVLVLPWAVGKWLGARGEIVSNAINSSSHLLNIGDNGGRPCLWSRVRQFELAQNNGLPVLPGSDPLPLKGAETRAGTNGIFVSGNLNDDSGVENLLRSLKDNAIADTFSLRRGALGFVYDQIKLRTA